MGVPHRTLHQWLGIIPIRRRRRYRRPPLVGMVYRSYLERMAWWGGASYRAHRRTPFSLWSRVMRPPIVPHGYTRLWTLSPSLFLRSLVRRCVFSQIALFVVIFRRQDWMRKPPVIVPASARAVWPRAAGSRRTVSTAARASPWTVRIRAPPPLAVCILLLLSISMLVRLGRRMIHLCSERRGLRAVAARLAQFVESSKGSGSNGWRVLWRLYRKKGSFKKGPFVTKGS